MRAFWRVMRRFLIVTLGAAVRALDSLEAQSGYARAGTGIGALLGSTAEALVGEGGSQSTLASNYHRHPANTSRDDGDI
jgi:hypothetical protein